MPEQGWKRPRGDLGGGLALEISAGLSPPVHLLGALSGEGNELGGTDEAQLLSPRSSKSLQRAWGNLQSMDSSITRCVLHLAVRYTAVLKRGAKTLLTSPGML